MLEVNPGCAALRFWGDGPSSAMNPHQFLTFPDLLAGLQYRVRPSAFRRLLESLALPSMHSVPSLITSAERGEASAAKALFTALYSDLRKLARHELARRGAGVTLTATALLHEAYLDISKR